MIEGIHNGDIHSLYLYGEDTGIVDSNINFVQAAFEKLDFMVVQDEFLTFTAICRCSFTSKSFTRKRWNFY